MDKSSTKTVLERYMLPSKQWAEGYRQYCRLLGKPLGWFFIIQNGERRMLRLNPKGNCSFFVKSIENEMGCMAFLMKYCEQLMEDKDRQKQLPYFYKCAYGRQGAVLGIRHLDQPRAFLILCTIERSAKDVRTYLPLFSQFLQLQADLAYKNYELQNFYDTVHPRALALSTMHSVNRIISSKLHLDDLLPSSTEPDSARTTLVAIVKK